MHNYQHVNVLRRQC